MPVTTFSLTQDVNLTWLYPVDGMARVFITMITTDSPVYNKNPRKPSNFSFYGGFWSLRYVYTLETKNALMRQINAFYRGVYRRHPKLHVSDA